MSQAIRSLFNRIESFGLKREKNNSNLIPSFYWSTQKTRSKKDRRKILCGNIEKNEWAKNE